MPATAGAVSASRTSSAPKYLTTFEEFHNSFTVKNFDPFDPADRLDFTQGAIYEPLMIMTTAGKGYTYPWLATSYKWGKGNKSLSITLRKGVKWSDGTPFTSADVVFTYNYGKAHAAADETGLMQTGQVTSVTAKGKYGVVFKFSSVNTTILPQLLSNNVMIVPQHIWKGVSNPATFVNANPVGTGPFTQVVSFGPEGYTLGKNPHYWKKLTYDGIHVPALTDNNAALAAALSHQMDWTATSCRMRRPRMSHMTHSTSTFSTRQKRSLWACTSTINSIRTT